MLNKNLFLNESVLVDDVELKSTREAFGEKIAELGQEYEEIITLSADLSSSLKLETFIKKYPKRFIQTGIAEQNMIGIAAGLALSGKIPVVTSFACFSPSRNWDQIRMSITQQNANVKVIGSHAGLSPATDGRSAEAFEDIALMRVLPNMVIIQPTDYYETKKIIEEGIKHKGPVYIRLHRENLANITTEKTPFQLGKAYVLKEGTDITLIGSGTILVEVIKAANYLKTKHNIDAEVISVPTIKPLDEQTILSSVEKTQVAVTIEEHQVTGGLGGAISELLSEKRPTKLLRIGINNKFGESGKFKELLDLYGLSGHQIEKQVINFMKTL